MNIFLQLLSTRKRLEQQQKMLEEDRKRRMFEEQKQKLRLLSSVKPKVTFDPPTPLRCRLFFLHSVIFNTSCASGVCSDGREESGRRIGGNQGEP